MQLKETGRYWGNYQRGTQ